MSRAKLGTSTWVSSDPWPNTYDSVPIDTSSRGMLATPNELATTSIVLAPAPGATCSVADEELIELLTSGYATGARNPFFEGRPIVSTPVQSGSPTSPAPTAHRGTALIGPWASNSSGMQVYFFFPTSGSERFAK